MNDWQMTVDSNTTEAAKLVIYEDEQGRPAIGWASPGLDDSLRRRQEQAPTV